MKALFVVMSVLWLLTAGVRAELPREWTSADGRKLPATLRSATATDATLQLATGQQVVLPLAKLSQTDQDYVQRWIANEAGRASCFGLEILGTKVNPLSQFLKSKSGAGGGSGLLAASVFSGGKTLYKLTAADAKSGCALVEVRVKMTPPAQAGGTLTMDLSKVSLAYRDRQKVQSNAPLGPRWKQGSDNRMGNDTIFKLENDKPLEINLGFVIPPEARPEALLYKGHVTFELPLGR